MARKKQDSLLYHSFNADASCVTVGTRTGFAVCNSDPIVSRVHEKRQGCRIVELLYCTPLVAFVGSGDTPGSSPRQLTLWHSIHQEVILQTGFESTIVSVRMNKLRLVACLETHSIHIFDIATLTRLQVLSTSIEDSKGLMALTSEHTSYLVYPSPTVTGEVMIHDTLSQRLLGRISAHKSSLCELAFNQPLPSNTTLNSTDSNNTSSTTLLATASVTGTIIRVFSIPSGELIQTFRRGLHHVTINSLSFCSHSQFLSAGSSSGAVHVFLMPSAIQDLYNSMTNNSNTMSGTTASSNFSRSTSMNTSMSSSNSNTENANISNNSNSTSMNKTVTASASSASSSNNSKNGIKSYSSPQQLSQQSKYKQSSSSSRSSSSTTSSSSSSSLWQWKDALQMVQDAAISAVCLSTEFLSNQGILPENMRTVQEYADSSRAVCIFKVPMTSGCSGSGSSGVSGHGANGSGDINTSFDYSSKQCAFKAALYRPADALDNTHNNNRNHNNSINDSTTLFVDPQSQSHVSSSSSSSSSSIINNISNTNNNPTNVNNNIKLIVVTSSGFLYRFAMPPTAAILTNLQSTSTHSSTTIINNNNHTSTIQHQQQQQQSGRSGSSDIGSSSKYASTPISAIPAPYGRTSLNSSPDNVRTSGGSGTSGKDIRSSSSSNKSTSSNNSNNTNTILCHSAYGKPKRSSSGSSGNSGSTNSVNTKAVTATNNGNMFYSTNSISNNYNSNNNNNWFAMRQPLRVQVWEDEAYLIDDSVDSSVNDE